MAGQLGVGEEKTRGEEEGTVRTHISFKMLSSEWEDHRPEVERGCGIK